MSQSKKAFLMVLGGLSAVLIVSQFVMGMWILSGGGPGLRKAHQHSGYMTALIVLAYSVMSLLAIAAMPSRPKDG